ncbi:hypothetical protein FQA39_LY11629 [Lamprigera yunnana]|nr:hypothetical protein FQA39_LY11629 [Lamprigera yunnana]
MSTATSPLRLPPLPTIRDIIRLYKLRALRQLSQNFLLDERITNKLVRAAGTLEGHTVCEVGPGPGLITRSIIYKAPKKLVLVEKDPRFLPSLELIQEACQDRVEIIIEVGDIREHNFEKSFSEVQRNSWPEEPPPLNIIGNLPFNVSTNLLIRWLKCISEKKSAWSFGRTKMTLTFQKEVAERIVAMLGDDQRCRLSIMCQLWCAVKHKFTIPGRAFLPKPDVDVGVVTLVPLENPLVKLPFETVEKVIRHIFNMRQKASKCGAECLFPPDLRSELGPKLFHLADTDHRMRPFELTTEEFARLCYAYTFLYDDVLKNQSHKQSQDSLESDASDTEPMKLDLGIDPALSSDKVKSLDVATAVNVNDTPKREDNPFSFKHFLRSDTNNYSNQGARPKVYYDGRPISSFSDLDVHASSGVKQTRVVPEFSSALPDFVQDHLVLEQCYANDNTLQNNYSLDVNNLPDFTSMSHCSNTNGESSRNIGRRVDNQTNNFSIPLDLPIRPSAGFPLDLPIAEQSLGSRSCPTSMEVGASKSLPDFLTDGAVHSQSDDNQVNHSPKSEVEQLKQEVNLYQHHLLEQNRRLEQLQIQLEMARNKEHEYTKNLVKALEHVEENLCKSNQRAASAENIITNLRQEIRSLKSEINRLQQENRTLTSRQCIIGRPSTSSASNEMQSHRLSQELRASADTAENSLRQLLLGVDNLRTIAATLENMNRIEEGTDSSDLEDEGPAL